MNLLVRINLAAAVLFAVAAFTIVSVTQSALRENAERQSVAEASLMMESALAIRDYTATEILPLLSTRVQSEFLPQSVPFYAATQNFLKLHAAHPEYSYKEAALNPTNPRDRAADWDADIIQRFRNDATATQVVGKRDTPMGSSLFLARPIRADAECLSCHSLPAVAPPTIIARYGSNNGFGWRVNEVIGAQVVSVPSSSALGSEKSALRKMLAPLIAVFLALLLALNGVLYLLVVRPMRVMAQVADRVSIGDSSAPGFSTAGGAEFAILGRSFNRMRTSLEKAMQLLESRP